MIDNSLYEPLFLRALGTTLTASVIFAGDHSYEIAELVRATFPQNISFQRFLRDHDENEIDTI